LPSTTDNALLELLNLRNEMANSTDSIETAPFLSGGGATAALIASHDWAATALGPLKDWPQSLQTATAIVLRSADPMAILWGPDGVLIYNDAYADFVGDTHPAALGSKIRDAWAQSAQLNVEALQIVLSGACLHLRDREYTLSRGGRLVQVWLDLAFSPILDETGQPAGSLVLISETTQHVMAERKAWLEIDRQTRMFAQGPGFLLLLSGPDLKVEFTNEAHDRLFGVRGALGKPYREAFPGATAIGGEDLLRAVYDTGKRHVGRAEPTRIIRTDGSEREHFIDFMIEPIKDASGQVVGVFAEGFDVTEQVRAQQAALESERRLSAATAIARLGVFEWDVEKRIPHMDERAREIFGIEPGHEISFAEITSRIAPEDAERAMSLADSGTPRRQIEYRIHLPDGTSRILSSMSDVVRGPDGQVQRIIGVLADITERRRAEDRQRLLINELNHRVKNTLATVQSIAAQTLRAAPDTASAQAAFESRLLALAATHDLLTAESWHGARIADVVSSAIAPFETTRRPQIHASGPAVWVSAPRALALSMALHELATNAVKYGALSRPEGRVTLRWRKTKQSEIALSWVEQGGPKVERPTRSGFGTRLVQRSLARELGGSVVLDYAPEGVRCEIRFPIAEAPPAALPETVAL
jgi:PAS domain S-box-containing protein